MNKQFQNYTILTQCPFCTHKFEAPNTTFIIQSCYANVDKTQFMMQIQTSCPNCHSHFVFQTPAKIINS